MSLDAVLIAGPTASGKSGLAMELAENLGGVVINADSMQVYRELAVLTARPSATDEKRIPHRLYGHVKASERYSVGLYQEEAAGALAEALSNKRVAIFAGGTGLYFDALTKGLSPIPAVPVEIRDEVRRRFDAMGREAFFAEFATKDPSTTSKLRVSDTQRVLRAAAVLEATGRPLTEWQEMSGSPVLAGLRVVRLLLAPPREVLLERIDRRFETMVAQGALEEARLLLGLDPALPAAKALGIPQLQEYLLGRSTLESAIAGAQLATRRYVKRQMTWFRTRMSEWNWFEETRLSNIITSIRVEVI
ncbi:MAG TPA: tRNA (adenosine(37)-N6)-dimethylallyltransferase MiaA [Micropepsaceae bacterium]|nr:tRNA (adenosine(37)-N6)-dimethylallyltransferase MiaA [Micropepsaceae bacterium]